MITETLQLISFLTRGEVHLLIIFFIMFVVLPSYMSRKYSDKYDNVYNGTSSDVTVIVPVHDEDEDRFEKCISSIRRQNPDQLIISIDGNNNKLLDIANKYESDILIHHKRVGKRKAVADAWLIARNDIIVHVDSDAILDDNCLKEISRPFNDDQIVGVSTNHTATPGKSIISYILYAAIEYSRNVNDRALNGSLIVVDGKCNAWRKNFLLDIRESFLNEYWMGTKCEIGDDRFISREALKRGFKTVHNESAKIYTSSPDSFKDFLKQQIRWRRSGTKFWIKDLIEGVRPSKLYMYKCATYYTSPFIFPLVIAMDIFFFKLSIELLNFWKFSIISIIIGTSTVSALRQMIYFGKILFPKYIVLQGLIGLFVIFPISLYGMLTVKEQDSWMTRKYEDTKDDEYER